jgi:formate hydrogenlyase transcriptional activator
MQSVTRMAVSRIADREVHDEPGAYEIIGGSVALHRVLRDVDVVAPTDATVLIQGETGTGKELIARAIHDRSARRARPFVKLSCAAIPAGLLESELFGHDRGAFTGAVRQRTGRFELADGGTLFLDEIGELPFDLQPKLLRILQEQEFERVGGERTVRVDVRLVAATNRDLAGMVAEQRFRDDLFYRLNVFPIDVPPLRERPDDIPALVEHFVRRFASQMNRRIDIIPRDAIAAMQQYAWPGNIRELANVVERATIRSLGPTLDIPVAELERLAARASRPYASREHPATLAELERAHILAVLEEANWLIAGPRGAAARLGMKRTTLQSLIKRLGIARSAARDGPTA